LVVALSTIAPATENGDGMLTDAELTLPAAGSP
jgi:hypothetical protein